MLALTLVGNGFHAQRPFFTTTIHFSTHIESAPFVTERHFWRGSSCSFLAFWWYTFAPTTDPRTTVNLEDTQHPPPFLQEARVALLVTDCPSPTDLRHAATAVTIFLV